MILKRTLSMNNFVYTSNIIWYKYNNVQYITWLERCITLGFTRKYNNKWIGMLNKNIAPIFNNKW